MLSILPLEKTDTKLIVEWNANTSNDFLQQWTGWGYDYPITEKQINDRIDASGESDYKLFKIILDSKMIGTFELKNTDYVLKKAIVGRFLIDPNMTGKGYGIKSLKKILDIAFNEMGLKTVQLTVFSFNKIAYHCYEKVGFKAISETIRPNGWVAIKMEIKS